MTSRPMPVAELPESNPGVFVDVSMVLPLTIGALSIRFFVTARTTCTSKSYAREEQSSGCYIPTQ